MKSVIDAPMNRQRRYAIRHVKAGLCRLCPRRRVTAFYCEHHRRLVNQRKREAQRKQRHYQRRYLAAESYHF